MYRCYICRTVFTEPSYSHERQWHGEVEASENLYLLVCPCCGGEEFTEVSVCRLCGRAIAKEDNLCGKCLRDVHNEINSLCRRIKERYGSEFLDAIDEELDGYSIKEWLNEE